MDNRLQPVVALVVDDAQEVSVLDVVPNNEILATITSKQEVKLYSLQNSEFLASLKGHTNKITGVRWTDQPNLCFTSSWDNTVKLWDLRTKTEARCVVVGEEVHSLDLSGDFKLIATGTQSSVSLWDSTSGKSFAKYTESHTEEVVQVSFHPFLHEQLFSGSLDGLVNVFNYTVGHDEDEAYHTGINVESAVSKFGFSENKGNFYFVQPHLSSFRFST